MKSPAKSDGGHGCVPNVVHDAGESPRASNLPGVFLSENLFFSRRCFYAPI
jgi:hypothetical protein